MAKPNKAATDKSDKSTDKPGSENPGAFDRMQPGTEMNPDGGSIKLPENDSASMNAPDGPPEVPPREEPTSSEPPPQPEQPPAMELGAIPIRKINPKDIMGKKMKEVTVPEKGIYDLFTIIGTAYNLRDGESTFGPWTALVGEFEATRLSDGQRFIATECFVPGAAGELLVVQVRKFIVEEIPVTPEQFKKIGKTYKVTGETAEMALIVGIKKAQRDGGADYEYVIRPVVPVQKSDPLAALRNQLKSALGSGALTLSLPPPPPAPAPALPAPPSDAK